MATQNIPYEGEKRVETGPVKFGDDWTGYFIRGDNSYQLLLAIRELKEYFKKHECKDPSLKILHLLPLYEFGDDLKHVIEGELPDFLKDES